MIISSLQPCKLSLCVVTIHYQIILMETVSYGIHSCAVCASAHYGMTSVGVTAAD